MISPSSTNNKMNIINPSQESSHEKSALSKDDDTLSVMSKKSGTRADKHCLFPGCTQTKPIKGYHWSKHRATHFKDTKPTQAIIGQEYEVCTSEHC